MMCELQEEVALYVDDELDSAAQQQVADHLRPGCPDCSMAMIQQTEWKEAIRVAGRRFVAPLELHAAICRDLRRHQPPAWMMGRWGFVFASLVLLTAVGVVFCPNLKPDPMIGVLVDQHVTALASTHPVDVIPDNRHTVKPWFQAFTFNMPELAGSAFTLMGGKVVYAGGNPGTELLYEVRSHKISIFIFQSRNPKANAVSNRGLSFTVNNWIEGELQFHMVTDASQEEAGKLIAMFQDANRS